MNTVRQGRREDAAVRPVTSCLCPSRVVGTSVCVLVPVLCLQEGQLSTRFLPLPSFSAQHVPTLPGRLNCLWASLG